jgi:hypothetical protein
MIDIEKLKKEIKGRIRKNVYLDYHEGYNDALKRTISIIESMEEESVSEDLEKEIINYIGFPQEVDEDISTTMMRKAARHFANWQKEQMMKDAVDVKVKVDAGGYPYIDRVIELYDYEKDIPLAKAGDKVKLLVLKEG